MEMKDIAALLCSIPEGNYNVETKIGNVEVSSVWSNNRNFRIINILIDGKIYDEITYTHFDNVEYHEKIIFEKNGKLYKLTHRLGDSPRNIIEYRRDYSTILKYGKVIPIPHTENIKPPSILTSDEKILYIEEFDCEKTNPNLKKDYICIPSVGNYTKIILVYNQITNSFKRDNLNEIDEYEIYQEFASKLNKYHSEKMLKILEGVALKLFNDYIKSKQEQKQKTKKLFDISKYKNN